MKAAEPDTRIPYDGKNHRWARLPTTRRNGRLQSLTPTVALIAFTIWFNKSHYGTASYAWLNRTFTPWQINAWVSFAITSVVYWIGGLLFMAVDMWDPLYNIFKPYKLQPEKRISWRDYRKVCWVVLRNQILVALPMTVAMAMFAPLRTSTPLPGAFETVAVWLFCMLCEGE